MTVNARVLSVGGLPVTVFGLSSSSPSPYGLAVLYLCHGRFGSAADPKIGAFATALVEHACQERSLAPGKDLIVVTFDQRNHGARTVDKSRNKGWKDRGEADALENVSHAVDMYSIQTGTARDVSFLVDFLGPALFPHDERTITDHFVAGISLGGHSTWLALAHDRRLSLGIPIIGSPSLITLLSHRASSLAPPLGPLPLSAPYFPASLLTLVAQDDPIYTPLEGWKHQKILVLSGADDELVNYDTGGSAAWVDELQRAGVDVEAVVQEGVGHALSPEMVRRSCEFVWDKGLKAVQTAHM